MESKASSLSRPSRRTSRSTSGLVATWHPLYGLTPPQPCAERSQSDAPGPAAAAAVATIDELLFRRARESNQYEERFSAAGVFDTFELLNRSHEEREEAMAAERV